MTLHAKLFHAACDLAGNVDGLDVLLLAAFTAALAFVAGLALGALLWRRRVRAGP